MSEEEAILQALGVISKQYEALSLDLRETKQEFAGMRSQFQKLQLEMVKFAASVEHVPDLQGKVTELRIWQGKQVVIASILSSMGGALLAAIAGMLLK